MPIKRYVPTAVQGFTVEELERLRNIIHRCWETIADDMCINDMGERDDSIEHSRFEVAECALDADRWKYIGATEGDSAIIDKLQKLGWFSDAWKIVITQVLPYPTY